MNIFDAPDGLAEMFSRIFVAQQDRVLRYLLQSIVELSTTKPLLLSASFESI